MRHTRRATALLFGALALLGLAPSISLSQQAPRVELIDQPCRKLLAVRISVFADGRIEVDGKPTVLEQVRPTLQERAATVIEVCIHRENPSAPEPHPNMLRVLDEVVEKQLPVAFYWDSAFKKRVAFKER
jgi:hypothetical protein